MTKTSLGIAAVTIIGISLLVIGGTALIAPGFAAAMYGVTISDTTARAYVWATGVRDIVIGCWLLFLVATRAGARILGISIVVLTLIPAADAIIVWLNVGAQSPLALALHSLSVVVFVALGSWLWRNRDQR